MSQAALRPNQAMIYGQLLTNKITDKRILQAMLDVPREMFLPKALQGSAYVDEELELGDGRALIEPLVLAQLLDLAEISPSARVLVVGCLGGYAVAVAAKLAAHVVGIEQEAKYIGEARTHMTQLGLKNTDIQQVADLKAGYAMSSPYDAIILCGAVQYIPDDLSAQLSKNGCLVAVRNVAVRPGAQEGLGKNMRLTRLSHQLQYREHGDASVRLLPEFLKETGFVF